MNRHRYYFFSYWYATFEAFIIDICNVRVCRFRYGHVLVLTFYFSSFQCCIACTCCNFLRVHYFCGYILFYPRKVDFQVDSFIALMGWWKTEEDFDDVIITYSYNCISLWSWHRGKTWIYWYWTWKVVSFFSCCVRHWNYQMEDGEEEERSWKHESSTNGCYN